MILTWKEAQQLKRDGKLQPLLTLLDMEMAMTSEATFELVPRGTIAERQRQWPQEVKDLIYGS